MRFKVGDTWYEATEDTPIMVELTMQDKANICAMHPLANRYAVFEKLSAGKLSPEAAKAWMDDGHTPYEIPGFTFAEVTDAHESMLAAFRSHTNSAFRRLINPEDAELDQG